MLLLRWFNDKAVLISTHECRYFYPDREIIRRHGQQNITHQDCGRDTRPCFVTLFEGCTLKVWHKHTPSPVHCLNSHNLLFWVFTPFDSSTIFFSNILVLSDINFKGYCKKALLSFNILGKLVCTLRRLLREYI